MKTYFLLDFHVLFFWMISMSVTQNHTASTVWNMNALFRFSDVCWQFKSGSWSEQSCFLELQQYARR